MSERWNGMDSLFDQNVLKKNHDGGVPSTVYIIILLFLTTVLSKLMIKC